MGLGKFHPKKRSPDGSLKLAQSGTRQVDKCGPLAKRNFKPRSARDDFPAPLLGSVPAHGSRLDPNEIGLVRVRH